MIREKVCVGNPINVTDPSQYSFLLGQRDKIYTLLNPKLVLRNLKAFFYFLRSMAQTGESLCFILNTDNLILFEKMSQACKSSNNFVFNQNIKFNLYFQKKNKNNYCVIFGIAHVNVLYTIKVFKYTDNMFY